MNKDVIYIEPEDDITDIITKIENSKEKIIALVPPKKASVFRSIVNIKLIAKAGVNADKTVVLVTTDPSIIKLAGVTKLPVTKDLQSAPVIPEDNVTEEINTTAEAAVLEAAGGETEEEVVETVEDEAKPDKTEFKISNMKEEESEDEPEEKEEEKKDDEKPKKFTKEWFLEHKKLVSLCGGGILVFILVLIWAFGIAPAADVSVVVRTTTTNFSENATFTNNLSDENIAEGKFYLTEKKAENKLEVEFEATGKKNVGDKAKGTVVVYAYFRERGTRSIEAGSTFTNNDLRFTADKEETLSWDGSDVAKCENSGQPSSFNSGCLISGRVSVTAAAPGAQYNIAATSTGWSTTANVGAYSDNAMSGGTDKTVTVVQQSDINEALAKIVEDNSKTEAINREKLEATLEDGAFVISSSYQQKLGEPVSTPKVGEEVEEGKKAKLTVESTDSIYTIDKTKVEEFISEKSKLTDSYKIYKMNDPFIENFTEIGDNSYVGKIKTSFVSGPKVTENDVINIIKGKGLGEARADLLDAFSGIDSNKTKINVSFPWVFRIPDNPTKITVTIEVEE